MRCWKRCVVLLTILFAAVFAAVCADNTTVRYLKYEPGNEKLLFKTTSLSNEGGVTTVFIDVECSDIPFELHGVELVSGDSLYASLQPVTLVATEGDVMHRRVLWSVKAEFPQLFSFSGSDKIVIHTSEGDFSIPLTQEGNLEEEIMMQYADYEHNIQMANASARNAWIVAGVILALLCLVVVAALLWSRHLMRSVAEKMTHLQAIEVNCGKEQKELENKISVLYGARMEILNRICNEYYEKNGLENMRNLLFNEVERVIVGYRTPKAIEALEGSVNQFMGNLLVNFREQLPDMGKEDMNMVVYLYAGFSAKAVCVIMDLKLKNFYTRRSRLKERILASDAPDRDLFASIL